MVYQEIPASLFHRYSTQTSSHAPLCRLVTASLYCTISLNKRHIFSKNFLVPFRLAPTPVIIMAIITINGNSLDPDAPTLGVLNLVQETAKGSNYILIQTTSPLTKEIKKELAEKQVKIQEKVSEDTYLCEYELEVCILDCDHAMKLTSLLEPR